MKCKECGQDNWRVLVTIYREFEIRNGDVVEKPIELGKATISHECLTDIKDGSRCSGYDESAMNSDEFDAFMEELEAK